MRGSPARFDNLGGGVNLKDSSYLVDASQARDLLNVVSTTRGAVRSRDGSTLLHNAADTVLGLAPFEEGSRRLIRNEADGLTALDSGGGVVATDALTASRFDWAPGPAVSGQGPLWGMDGTNARFFTGSAFGGWTASAGTLEVGKYLQQWELRMLVAGIAAKPSSVRATAAGNPRDFDVTQDAWEVQFDPSDGQGITGLGSAGSYTLVFKPHKVFAIYDSASGANRRLVDGVGSRANRSIVESPYGTFFLSEDGVYLTDGNRVDRVSFAVDPLLEKIPGAMLGEAAGAFFNERYYLSICTTGSANNLTLEYDPRGKAWWIHSIAAAQWAPWRSVQALELYGGLGQNVFQALVPGATTDVGAPFTAFWKSPWHTFEKPYIRKRCRAVHFDGEGAFGFYVGKDFAHTETLWGQVDFSKIDGVFGGSGIFGDTGFFGGSSQVGERKLFTPGVARAWSVVFSSPNAFTVDSYTLFMTERKN